ncbi:hypothetical protein GMORB2_4016 [Geosmithia morbida]|uniref:Uncharacterized protein n=1 Tax=Geosmithia morbida TaxID=1094350 RepID=A0A9P5D3P5_9HYPO|nr:uncharacterized protein GMORB2_4016 [Geosmithia morbida]KAF4125177.1 hypothetical protein GMORB2_4016 [Geosmithia morbida]
MSRCPVHCTSVYQSVRSDAFQHPLRYVKVFKRRCYCIVLRSAYGSGTDPQVAETGDTKKRNCADPGQDQGEGHDRLCTGTVQEHDGAAGQPEDQVLGTVAVASGYLELHVKSSPPVRTIAYQCLPVPTSAYQCLPVPTSAYQCLPVPAHGHLSLLVFFAVTQSCLAGLVPSNLPGALFFF